MRGRLAGRARAGAHPTSAESEGAAVGSHAEPSRRDQVATALIEIAVRLAALATLLYFSLVLIRPFLPIVIWSVVLTVALYPVYDWLARRLGDRRRLAAALVTLGSLSVVVGPAAWLSLDLIESVQVIVRQLDVASLTPRPPPPSIKDWPLVGEQLYQFWYLASTNLNAAVAQIVPQLKPLGGSLLQMTADAGAAILKLVASMIVAGFLFLPGPSLASAVKKFFRRLASDRGEEFVNLAGATIRAVARGVIGISVIQALFAAIGLTLAGIPGASLITSAVLICGIVQIGGGVVLIPVIIWAWMTMDTASALLFTAYMLPVNFIDNILKPFVMGIGLTTPMLVTLIGVVGGALSYGITGLFLGPIVLAVSWELLVAWTNAPADDAYRATRLGDLR